MRSLITFLFTLTLCGVAKGQQGFDAAEAKRVTAVSLLSDGKYAEAVAPLLEYYDLYGGGESYLCAAAVCYSRTGKEIYARELLERFLFGSTQNRSKSVQARVLLARMYKRIGKNEQALALYREVGALKSAYRLDPKLDEVTWNGQAQTAELHALMAVASHAYYDTYAINDWLFDEALKVAPADDNVKFAYVYLAQQGGRFTNAKALPVARELYRKSAQWKTKMDKWVPKEYFPYDKEP